MPQSVSLWELMKSFRLKSLLLMASRESRLTAIIEENFLPDVDPKQMILLADHREEIRKLTERIAKDFGHFGLAASTATLRRVRKLCDNEESSYADLQRLYSQFMGRFLDETAALTFFSIEPAKQPYFTDSSLFGEKVAAAFPSAAFDIEEAGKCLALDRSTACVFHCMRVMEVGLRELAAALSIPYAPSWESYLLQIQKQIGREWKDKEPDWKQDEAFYSGVAGDLVHVKTAWRNPTMHVRGVYDGTRALEIFNAVRALMRHLATRLREPNETGPSQ